MEPPTDFTDVDLQLAFKLKDKYPEHFQNLIRMHLSFALDLNLEERDEQTEKIRANPAKWNFGKKLKTSKDKDSVDGNTLSQAKISRICRLISFLCRPENLTQEGIFRKTGSLNRQVQLKTCLNEGISVDFDDNNFSVHDCASVLKNYLSELPEPVVTDAYYPLYCQISEWGKCSEFESRLLRSLQLLTLLLPPNNALLLKHIMNLLHMTAKYDKQNKMSSTNLATLFTPHLLCPRKLSAEVFHSQAKMLYQVVEFMIESGPDLFRIPTGLAADLRLYWHEKEKKKLSPKNCLNESTADSCVVNTVFSFVDREKTAQENVINPTETALAQLYAHIQSLPESSKKRKLVKQFNKENGYGTPKRVLLNNNTDKSHSLTKNISDSLKKHIFSKNSSKIEKLKSLAKDKSETTPSTSENRFRGHPLKLFDKRLDCMECGCSDISDEACSIKKLRGNDDDDELELDAGSVEGNFANLDCTDDSPSDVETESIHEREIDVPPQLDSLTMPDALLLHFPKTSLRTEVAYNKLSTPIAITHSVSGFQSTLTSTPAPVRTSNNVLTPSPFSCSNDDMSPITMSAQKMPKSMQEVMMTPRSRRPVLAFSGSNTNLLGKGDSDGTMNSIVDAVKNVDRSPRKIERPPDNFEFPVDTSKDSESLTDPFREYLYSRSMLTTSSLDDSLSRFDPCSLSEDVMSDSLMYCLDGGAPSRNSDDSMENSPRITTYENTGHVHETLL